MSYKYKMDSTEDTLQLGDIIQLNDDEPFMIVFINKAEIDLVREDGTGKTLEIQDGKIVNDDVTSIELLERASSPSYAVLNELVPGTWIDAHFGGSKPFVASGQITDLDEDRISVKLISGEQIYIDFGYEGLPKELGITSIVRREPPGDSSSPTAELDEIIVKADELKIGSSLGVVQMDVEVPDEQKRFSIEKQCSDLLDDFLAIIPTQMRTERALVQVQNDVNRYHELWTRFVDDDNAEVSAFVHSLNELKSVPKWVVPTVSNTKKVYGFGEDEVEFFDGVVAEPDLAAVEELHSLQVRFKEGSTSQEGLRYSTILTDQARIMGTFTNPTGVILRSIPGRVETVVDNNGLGESNTVHAPGSQIAPFKFLVETSSPASTVLSTKKTLDGKTITTLVTLPATEYETDVTAFIFLPKASILQTRYLDYSGNLSQVVNSTASLTHLWNVLAQSTRLHKNRVEPGAPKFELTSRRPALYIKGEQSDFGEYVRAIVPTAEEAFNQFAKELGPAYSLDEVVKRLSPFQIEYPQISYPDYILFRSFVQEGVHRWESRFQQAADSRFSRPKEGSRPEPSFLKYFPEGTKRLVQKLEATSDSELLFRLTGVDGGRLLYSSLRRAIGTPVQSRTAPLADRKQLTQDKCSVPPISKTYIDQNSLASDNLRTIYWDTKHDPTDYKLYAELSPESPDVQPSVKDLANALSKYYPPAQAMKEATAMVNGKREVEDGDYAVIYNDELGDDPVVFVRKKQGWIKDTATAISKEQMRSMDCNTLPECIEIERECQSLQNAKVRLLDSLRTKQVQMVAASEAQTSSELDSQAIRAQEMFTALMKKNKHRVQRSDEGEPSAESPYRKLVGEILAQSNFVERQSNIIRANQKYCRGPLPTEDENWRYCVKTGSKLMPAFFVELASAFVDSDDYGLVLERIVARQGVLSQEGEAIIDRNSGYIITHLSADSSEGFTKLGFVDKSRDLMVTQDTPSIPTSPTEQAITRVVDAMCGFIGVTVDKRFVVAESLSLFDRTKPSEESYKRLIEKRARSGKSTPSYQHAVDQTLLTTALGYLLVGIQTHLPPLRSTKPFPGCVKSFTGYPVFDAADLSSLDFIACVAHKIKSSVPPWSSILKVKEARLAKQIESVINKHILDSPQVRQRVRLRLDYVPEQKVPHTPKTRLAKRSVPDPSLPPTLMSDLRLSFEKGSPKQFALVNLLTSKLLSAAEQFRSEVATVVAANRASSNPRDLAHCCSMTTPLSYEFFADRNPKIASSTDLASLLSRALLVAGLYARPTYLLDDKDTRVKYPDLADTLEDETVYKAYIAYCKFGESIDLPGELAALCSSDTVAESEKLAQLKVSDHQSIRDSLAILMRAVAEQNLLPIDLNPEPEDFGAVVSEFDQPILGETIGSLLATEPSRALDEKLAEVNQSLSLGDKIDPIFTVPEEGGVSVTDYNLASNLVRAFGVTVPSLIYTREVRQFSKALLRLPGYWGLARSRTHYKDIVRAITKAYEAYRGFAPDPELHVRLGKYMQFSHALSRCLSLPLFEVYGDTALPLLRAILLSSIAALKKTPKSGNRSVVSLQSDPDELPSDAEEDHPALNELVVTMLTALGNVYAPLDYKTIQDEAVKTREREKNVIVERLTKMDVDERRIENEFKSHKLGEWSVGLQKGFKTYDPNLYEKEREVIDSELARTGDSGLEEMYEFDTELAIKDELNKAISEFKGEDDNIRDEDYDEAF